MPHRNRASTSAIIQNVNEKDKAEHLQDLIPFSIPFSRKKINPIMIFFADKENLICYLKNRKCVGTGRSEPSEGLLITRPFTTSDEEPPPSRL